MTAIQAIETQYAGCRFRSRLEARWAVFFDALPVRWHYETEGYQLSSGMRYLPDFYLPDLDVWVEVKGLMTAEDLRKVVRGSVELPLRHRGDFQTTMLLLGDLPRAGSAYVHSSFASVGDQCVWQQAYIAHRYGWCVQPIGDGIVFSPTELDLGPEPERISKFRQFMMSPVSESDLAINPDVEMAYAAARTARFDSPSRH